VEAEEGSEEFIDEESESEQGEEVLDGCATTGIGSKPMKRGALFFYGRSNFKISYYILIFLCYFSHLSCSFSSTTSLMMHF